MALTRAGCNVNIQTDMGCTPIYIAAQAGQESVIQAMIDEEGSGKDVDLNLAKEGGVTPLMIAAKKGHLRIIRALINKSGNSAHQIDMDSKMLGGSNAVHVAADNRKPDVLQLLITAGASAIGKSFATRKGHEKEKT